MTKLIFGCGYLGRRVANLWRAQGECVHAVTRWPARAQEFSAAGFSPIVADVMHAPSLGNLPHAQTVLFCVGHDRASTIALDELYVDGLRHVLDAIPRSIERFLYISSTGVYGDAGGEVVDEQTPAAPDRPGGRACLAAEQLLAAHPLGRRAVVLRLAGLYGPGRIPRADNIAAGKPIDAPASGYLNLIHADDAAQVVLAAESRAALPATYVVSDGMPVERSLYFAELARLLHAPPPTFIEPPPSSAAAARATANKRINPARMFAELQVKLTYPTYRQGLASAVVDVGRPKS